MSVQTRTTALQNEIVRLYFRFYSDGVLANPAAQPMVEILDTDGVSVLETVNAHMENTGVWYADYFVPKSLPLGDYYDRWTFQWSAGSSVNEQTMQFSVHSLDSYINFLSNGLSINISNRGAQLLNDLANDFIYEAQHIPIYWEQGMRIQQDYQRKRSKTFYYFTLSGATETYSAEESAVYFNNGQKFTVFETLVGYFSSSSSTSSETNSSVSQDSITTSSSSQSSTSSESSNSSSSESTSGSNSSSSQDIATYSESEYTDVVILTCVGTGEPGPTGTLVKQSGTGTDYITYSSYSSRGVKLSSTFNFAYKNWNPEPRPIVRLNNRIIDDGWHADFEGKIYWDRVLAPEDSPRVSYNFAYFSQEELMSFLQLGLKMMNSLPPASETYSTLTSMPNVWDASVLLYAAITALRRLVFGLNFQEKMIIFGSPDGDGIQDSARAAQDRFATLYNEYNELWMEISKDAKTLKLPGIHLGVTPEYTLPGGRSRWFRYLYKG